MKVALRPCPESSLCRGRCQWGECDRCGRCRLVYDHTECDRASLRETSERVGKAIAERRWERVFASLAGGTSNSG